MFTNTLWLFNLIYDKNNLVCSSLWRSYKIIRLRFCNFYIPFFRTLTHKITTSTYNMYIDGCHLWKKRVSLLMASGHAIFSILIVTTVLYTCPFDLFNSPLQGGLLQIEFISMFIEPTFSWPGLYFQRFIFLLQALISLPIIWVFSICGLHELVRERQWFVILLLYILWFPKAALFSNNLVPQCAASLTVVHLFAEWQWNWVDVILMNFFSSFG